MSTIQNGCVENVELMYQQYPQHMNIGTERMKKMKKLEDRCERQVGLWK